MKIATIIGTRPEIIRLSEVVRLLDGSCDHTLIHTGQNFDPLLSDIFFRDLALRRPDVHLGIEATSFADQVGQIITRCGETLSRVRPDRLLVLGDTNSGLAAVVGARMMIPVFHMEAGNRCYDERVPEELNRRIIDHSSTILLAYTQRSKENLVREGIRRERIFVTGNPIYEVLCAHASSIANSAALEKEELRPGCYTLATIHRAENVDDPERLERLFEGLSRTADAYGEPVVLSLHPRTANRMSEYGLAPRSPLVRLAPPFGFFDFVKLEQNARCVISDSGTVQEECCILKIPSVTVRDVTERPETIEAGSNILTGSKPESILDAVRTVSAGSACWNAPAEYLERRVSNTVTRILLGYHHIRM